MQTLYFPFTYIDASWAERAAAVWGPLTLLQPSAAIMPPETLRLQEDGLVHLLYPDTASDDLKDALAAFDHWAAQHSGSDLGALLEQGQSIPFFDHQSSVQLVAEIRRGGRASNTDPAAAVHRRLFNARLYLAMAQNFDRQQAELARDIAALAARERDMLALLKGEEDIDTGLPTSAWSMALPGSQAMVDQRLRAWARVMVAAEGPGTSGAPLEGNRLFLTDRPEVIAQLRELFPEMTPCLSLGSPERSTRVEREIPDWLADPLRRFTGGLPEVPGASVRIDLDEIPAVPADVFLRRLADRSREKGAASSPGHAAGSSWVGCMTALSGGE